MPRLPLSPTKLHFHIHHTIHNKLSLLPDYIPRLPLYLNYIISIPPLSSNKRRLPLSPN